MQSMVYSAIEKRDPAKHIFISDVAIQMGYKFTCRMLAMVGVPIAVRFKHARGMNPGKHSQFVDGKVNAVNSYTEEDREMIEEELRKAWGEPPMRR
jgi:hypothetical protein